MSIIIILLLLCLYGSVSERRSWNGGICAKNDIPWTAFDTDSGGATGYYAGEETLWVSWPGIVKAAQPEGGAT